MTLHFLNDVANYVIIASLKSKTMDKRINRIPGSRLLISSLPRSALNTLVESLGKPINVNKRSKSLGLVNLTSEDTHLVFYIYNWPESS